VAVSVAVAASVVVVVAVAVSMIVAESVSESAAVSVPVSVSETESMSVLSGASPSLSKSSIIALHPQDSSAVNITDCKKRLPAPGDSHRILLFGFLT